MTMSKGVCEGTEEIAELVEAAERALAAEGPMVAPAALNPELERPMQVGHWWWGHLHAPPYTALVIIHTHK
jgi:hypothetical protein